MASALDRRIDEAMALVTGPGGPFQLTPDAHGRLYVENLPATLPAFFDGFCALNGDIEALIDGSERLTFTDLKALADRIAPVLAGAYNIAKGDRVAIAMRNCPAWVITYMAVARTGAILTLVNGWWQQDELAHALALTEPSLVIADAQRAARIAGAGWTGRVVTLDVNEMAETALAPLLSGETADLPEVTPDDPATILFTSGSTGKAKGALSTHRAVTTGTYIYAAQLACLKVIKEKDTGAPIDRPRTLIVVPLFHVTGEVPVMLNSFVINRCMVLMRKWDAGEALRLIAEEKITYFVGVPTMSLELMQHPDRDRYDLSTLTDIAAGGAARPVAHVARLKAAFGDAQPALGYGLTESNAVGCANMWGNYADKPASTGRVHKPMVEVAILGPGDAHLPTGERGEIGIRTVANIASYWRDPEATAAAFTADLYVKTGDIGYFDEDGYLFIVDRKKDIIIRGGENISCQEVEAALYAHKEVAEACVFGIPDDRLGEVPAAFIYPQDGAAIDVEALKADLATHIAPFKVPALIRVTDEPLPKLGTGKIDKMSLKTALHEALAAA